MFVDASTPTVRKKIRKLPMQESYESRIVWRDLTEAMARGDSEAAVEAKHIVSTLCNNFHLQVNIAVQTLL